MLNLRQQYVAVSSFIETWQRNNPFNNNTEEHNQKFNTEFSEFLRGGNFDEEILEQFKKFTV